jgi:hypothetical protein
MVKTVGRLMVIGHFDVVGVAVVPAETETPLLVDANAVLALPVAATSRSFNSVKELFAELDKEC